MIYSLEALPIHSCLNISPTERDYFDYFFNSANLSFDSWIKDDLLESLRSDFQKDSLLKYLLAKELLSLTLGLLTNARLLKYKSKSRKLSQFVKLNKDKKLIKTMKMLNMSKFIIDAYDSELEWMSTMRNGFSITSVELDGWYETVTANRRKTGHLKTVVIWHLLRIEKIIFEAGYVCDIKHVIKLFEILKKTYAGFDDDLLSGIFKSIKLNRIEPTDKMSSYFDIDSWRSAIINDLDTLAMYLSRFGMSENLNLEKLNDIILKQEMVTTGSNTFDGSTYLLPTSSLLLPKPNVPHSNVEPLQETMQSYKIKNKPKRENLKKKPKSFYSLTKRLGIPAK